MGDAFALSVPCPELALLGRCKEGAGTKSRVALAPRPRLGRCSRPGDSTRRGAGLSCHVMPYPRGGTERSSGDKRVWIRSRAGLWVLLVTTGTVEGTETQCPLRRAASRRRGLGGRQSSAPHLPLPVPGLPSSDPVTRGPLSPPQYPPSGLSTCRLGWRRRRGGSEGPFCAGMNGSLFPSGGLPPPARQAVTLPTPGPQPHAPPQEAGSALPGPTGLRAPRDASPLSPGAK